MIIIAHLALLAPEAGIRRTEVGEQDIVGRCQRAPFLRQLQCDHSRSVMDALLERVGWLILSAGESFPSLLFGHL